MIKISPEAFNISIKKEYEFRWVWIKNNQQRQKRKKKMSKRFGIDTFRDIKPLSHTFPLKKTGKSEDYLTEIVLLVINKNKTKIAGTTQFNVKFLIENGDGQFRQKFILTDCPDKKANVIFKIELSDVESSKSISFDNSFSSISDTLKNISKISLISVDSVLDEGDFEPVNEPPKVQRSLSPITRLKRSFEDDYDVGFNLSESPVMEGTHKPSPLRKDKEFMSKKQLEEFGLNNFSFGNVKQLSIKNADSVEMDVKSVLSFSNNDINCPIINNEDENVVNQLKQSQAVYIKTKRENIELREKVKSVQNKLNETEKRLEESKKETNVLKIKTKIRESIDLRNKKMNPIRNRDIHYEETIDDLEDQIKELQTTINKQTTKLNIYKTRADKLDSVENRLEELENELEQQKHRNVTLTKVS